ncbi:MAG: hypothetical protein K2O02_01970 [Lachnospiraceae bacterium]|nr:hypothetical protein [Lachnospiraceae bacterium]
MTENEAIEELKENIELPFGSSISDEASRMAIKALEEIQQYRAIGTVEEIKDILQIISDGQDDVDESGISTGLLHTLLEYAEYKKIGTVEECREARERLRAKKYERGIGKDVRCPVCGTCTTDIFEHRFCTYCGQRLE